MIKKGQSKQGQGSDAVYLSFTQYNLPCNLVTCGSWIDCDSVETSTILETFVECCSSCTSFFYL